MGTLNFTVGKYARSRGSGAGQILSTEYRASGAFTSSASASNVQSSGSDVVVSVGEVVRLLTDTASWVRFEGQAASVGDGFQLPANLALEWEVAIPGTISVIEG